MRTLLIRSLAALLLPLALLAGPVASAAQDGDTPAAAAPGPGTAASGTAGDGADRDLANSRQLAQQLHDTDGLANVSVTVNAGVAELQGVVLALEDRERAAQIAAQHPGIERVDNHVTLSTRLDDRFATATALAVDKLARLLAALPVLLVALAVVVLAWWVGKWLGRRAGRRIARRSWQAENPFLASLVQQLVQWLVLLGGVLVALDLLDASALVGAVMGSAGVIGLALGFAFKDIAENYVAGVLLSVRRPFAPGDLLRIDDTHEGRVAALTSRATILVTPDGNRLTLPNALVFKSVVLNFSSNPKRRLDFGIPLDVDESIRRAQELAMEAIRAVDGVVAEPGPSWTVDAYDAGGITLRFYAWVDQRQSDLTKVRREAVQAVRARLAEAGVRTPRAVQYTAALEDRAPAVLGDAPIHQQGSGDAGDTSVDRDLDAHLAAEQRAHADEDLLPPDDSATAAAPAAD